MNGDKLTKKKLNYQKKRKCQLRYQTRENPRINRELGEAAKQVKQAHGHPQPKTT